MKLFCIIVCFLSVIFNISVSEVIECRYKDDTDWFGIGYIYYCYERYGLERDAVITGVTGDHEDDSNNDDVLGFFAYETKVDVFPSGLHKIFKNLEMIAIHYGRMKEIHQSDLKHYPYLKNLDLYSNDIQVLEEGLFDYNPDLTVILLIWNKISQVHPNIFDHLTKLTYLDFTENNCINMRASNNSIAVKAVVEQVKVKCPIIENTTTVE